MKAVQIHDASLHRYVSSLIRIDLVTWYENTPVYVNASTLPKTWPFYTYRVADSELIEWTTIDCNNDLFDTSLLTQSFPMKIAHITDVGHDLLICDE